MVDHIGGYCGFEYDFTNMKVQTAAYTYQRLELKDGVIGWINADGNWNKEFDDVQVAYERWLNQQIYGS